MESFLAVLERNRDDMEENRDTMEKTMGVQERIRGVPRKTIHTRIFPGRRNPGNPCRTGLRGGRAFLILGDAVTSRNIQEHLSLSGLAPGCERVGSVLGKNRVVKGCRGRADAGMEWQREGDAGEWRY